MFCLEIVPMVRCYAGGVLLGLFTLLAGCHVLPGDTSAPSSSVQPNNPPAPANNVELHPDSAAEVCFVTAESLAKAGQDSEAIALFEKARHGSAHQHEISRRLAVLYDRQGDFNKAAAEYKQLLQKTPRDA